jgi:phospholipid/cholesterol/gamma-HCH transport system permease protein
VLACLGVRACAASPRRIAHLHVSGRFTTSVRRLNRGSDLRAFLQSHPEVLVAFTDLDQATRTATVRIRGDVTVPTSAQLYGQLRGIARRRGIKTVVVDFAEAGRLDSSGIAVMSLAARLLARGGKRLDIAHVSEQHRAALDLMPASGPQVAAAADVDRLGWIEQLGDALIGYWDAAGEFFLLLADTGRQLVQVIIGKKRLPKGALVDQAARMGVGAVGIVGMLGMLLGMTLAFQAVVQLRQFGAGVYAADMIGVAMVREFGPMMTAIILTGRTGAAIAAELGTMRVRDEIDALSAMGVSPTRFLLLPRLISLTIVQPALTLMSMFLGIAGGLVVMRAVLHMPIAVSWDRIVARVTIGDFGYGIGKSLAFAMIIGFTGSHFGMRADGDASSVGAATTRTVVVSIFFIILVDAIVSTIGATS